LLLTTYRIRVNSAIVFIETVVVPVVVLLKETKCPTAAQPLGGQP
jgi:hypothetical protein